MKCKRCFFVAATLLCSALLYAQSGTCRRSILSFQTGPARYRAGFGILYQGNRYTGDMPNSTDKIQTHYFAPQFSLHWLKQQFSLYFATGTGYQIYKDNSTVYDKPRKVSMNKWAANFGAGGEYHLSSHWGISAKINYILAYSGEYSVRYHHKEWTVQPHYPMNGSDDISQLSFSAGINYHF